MSDTIKITTVDNGFILRIPNGEDAEDTVLCFAFDDRAHDHPETKALYELLHELNNALLPTSGFEKERITITLEHGDEHECVDEECRICQEKNT
jgi:hypothetical protein